MFSKKTTVVKDAEDETKDNKTNNGESFTSATNFLQIQVKETKKID